jgi:hypothetical protein
LLVAGAFVVTFLSVCLVAYLILSKRGADPKQVTARRRAAPVGYGPGPTANTAATVGPRPLSPNQLTRSSVLPVLMALVTTVGVVLGVIYALVTAANHLDVLFLPFRGVPAVPRRFQWTILPALTAAILVIGLPLARRFRRPDRFRTGVVLVALAVATFWPLQYFAASFDLPYWEYEAALHGLAFFISVCLLSGGLETMRRASNTPHDDSWEFWRST